MCGRDDALLEYICSLSCSEIWGGQTGPGIRDGRRAPAAQANSFWGLKVPNYIEEKPEPSDCKAPTSFYGGPNRVIKLQLKNSLITFDSISDNFFSK